MAILSNGWAQHFRSIARNDKANKNMKAFSNAFAPTTTLAERVNALVEEVDVAVLLIGLIGSCKCTAGRGLAGCALAPTSSSEV
jgi:hypothetical protein